MSRRSKIIILTIIVFVIILLFGYLIYRLTQPSETTIINGNLAPAATEIKGLDKEKIPEAVNLQELSPAKRAELLTKADLERFSAMFAERYASYSEEVNFANWEDLKIFMTDELQADIDRQIKEAGAEPAAAAEGYHGFTSKAVATKVTEYDALVQKATAEVSLQQKEAEGTTANFRVVYKKLILEFIKSESQGWKVDSVQWE